MMKKTIIRKTLCFIIVILSLFALSSCTPERETITSQSGNYVYSVGEPIEIKDIETNEVIAKLTVTSCETTIDEPFEVRHETDNGYEIQEYAYMLRITYTFDDYVGSSVTADNFKVTDNGFVVDPREEFTNDGTLFIAKKANSFTNKEERIQLEYTYDKYQSRHTALIGLDTEGGTYAPDNDTSSGIRRVSVKEFTPNMLFIAIFVIVSAISVFNLVMLLIFRSKYNKLRKTAPSNTVENKRDN